MVPVPEEIAEEVMAFLHWQVPEPAAHVLSWGQEAIERLYGEADEQARALLVAVAVAEQQGKELTVAELANALDCSDREVVGITLELNFQYRIDGAPPFLLMLKSVLPADSNRWADKSVAFVEGVAPLVLTSAGGREAAELR